MIGWGAISKGELGSGPGDRWELLRIALDSENKGWFLKWGTAYEAGYLNEALGQKARSMVGVPTFAVVRKQYL